MSIDRLHEARAHLTTHAAQGLRVGHVALRVAVFAVTSMTLSCGSSGGANGATPEPPRHQGCVSSESFRKASYEGVWQPLIARSCASCHVKGGAAGHSNLVLATDGIEGDTPWNSANYVRNLNALAEVASVNGDSTGTALLLLKASGQIAHGGGKAVAPSSAEYTALQGFVDGALGRSSCDEGIAGPDPLTKFKDLTPGRLLRRAALASGRGFPNIDEQKAVATGQRSYEDFVGEYFSGSGAHSFHERAKALFMPQIANQFVTNLPSLDTATTGAGVVWRPRNNVSSTLAKDNHGNLYSPVCASAGDVVADPRAASNLDFNKPPLAAYYDCVLEAPLKTVATVSRKMTLPGAHPQKRTWLADNAVVGGLLKPVKGEFDLSEVISIRDLYYYVNQISHHMFRLEENSVTAGLNGYNLAWVPQFWIRDDSPQFLPGYFSGCLLPGEVAPTEAELDALANGAPTLTLRLDSAGFPIQPGALPAIPIHPWWDPRATVYACPGLAVEAATAAGVIATLPSNVRIASTNAHVTQFQVLAPLPAAIDGQTVHDYLYRHYSPSANFPYGGFSIPNSTLHAYTAMLGEGSWNQCSASHYDSAYNPMCDCGPNLRNCNPLPDLVTISASFEAQMLFSAVVDGSRPFRDLVSGRTRATTRALEWQWFHAREKKSIHDAGAHLHTQLYTLTGEFTKPGIWLTRGTWPAEDLDVALKGLPPMPNLSWNQLDPNPAESLKGRGLPRPPPEPSSYFAVTETSAGFPASGILTTSTFLALNRFDRHRGNFSNAIFRCTPLAALATGSGVIDPAEANLPPRLQVNSGCAGCHEIVDPAAHFFRNFGGSDPLNTNFASYLIGRPWTRSDGALAWFKADVGPHGRHYVGDGEFRNLAPIYGSGPDGALDSLGGISAEKGVDAWAEYLQVEPQFTRCAASHVWEVMLGRQPAPLEARALQALTNEFAGKNYTVDDLAKAIATSLPFRKAP